jgi:hypothetical protein
MSARCSQTNGTAPTRRDALRWRSNCAWRGGKNSEKKEKSPPMPNTNTNKAARARANANKPKGKREGLLHCSTSPAGTGGRRPGQWQHWGVELVRR